MASPALQRRPAPVPQDRDAAVLVDVVVLSSDMVLFDAIKGAVGERNPVWRARSAEESVDLLLTGRCGVLLMDMGAVSTRPATLVQQISEQFPDVVVVVAGRREDEALLAELISEGLVYRFMHKPLTSKRAGMFLQAAIRCHVERRDSSAVQPLLPLSSVLPSRVDPRKWLFVLGGLALFLGLGWLLAGNPARHAPGNTPVAALRSSAPAVIADSPRADPVLSRARAAFAAGRYEAPAGQNALDLYAAVLLAHPEQAEARAGLDKTIAHLVSQAERAAASGDRTEAARLLDRIRGAGPSGAAVDHLAALLAPHPLPTPPAPARTTAAPQAPSATEGPRTIQPQTPATTAATPATAAKATAAPETAVAATAARAARPTVVRDPLTPRYTNAADLARHQARRGSVRSYGAPISSGLPIAGYVNSPGPEAAAPSQAVPQVDAGAVAALSLPADANDRVYATDPVYPPAALQNRIEGWVELMFTITETGTVRDVEVVDAQPRGVFESAATQAIGQWRFRPRIANGQPVPRRSVVTLRFNLDG